MGCRGERGRPWRDRAPNYLVAQCPPEPVFPAARCGSPSPRSSRSSGCCSPARRPPAPRPRASSRRDPPDGASLQTPPTQLVLTFDQPIGDSTVAVACNGDPWAEPNIGRPQLSADQKTVTVAVNTPMPTGPCNVAWSVRQPNGDDGPSGQFGFTVLTSPTPAGGSTASTTPGGSTAADDHRAGGIVVAARRRATVLDASDVSDGATWLGRTLSMFGLAVLFGSLVLIVVAWPEGPEYILAVRFLRSVWILTFVGTLLYVVALTAAVNQDSFGSGLSPASWLDLLDAGWAGRAAIARLVLVIASAWVVLRPERVIDPTTQLPAIAIPTLAVLTIGLSRTGGDLAILGVLMGIVHAVAMAVWLGGVVLLARVVLAGPGEEDLVQAVRGFGRISTTAIVATDRQRPRPAVPARRRVVVQRRPRPGAAAEDGPRGRDAVRRADRPPGRPGPARPGPRPVDDHGRPAAPGVRHRGRDRHRRARPERLAAVVHAAQAAGDRAASTTPSSRRSSTRRPASTSP